MIRFKFLLIIICVLIGTIKLSAQDVTITGIVVSSDDNVALEGVTVRVSGAKKATQTNAAGFYTISAAKGSMLQYTYVGYVLQDFKVKEDGKHNVQLNSTEKLNDEVVVTAYGIKKNKRDLNYQAISISGDEIAQTKRDNFINSLAGRIPGATITATTGMPGASSSIVLRGPTSIDGNNQPVFVIDGLIMDNTTFEMQDRLTPTGAVGANRTNDFANRAMDVNPEDIETVTVLKGPEATALYGSDGANGAIVITTKKGKKGRANVSYNASIGWSKVYRLPEIQTTFDQGTFGVNNQSIRTYFGQRIPNSSTKFDNIGNFFKVGKTQQHNLSVDGANDMGSYRFTASYMNSEGMVPNTGYKRYNFRLNSTYKVSPKVNISNSFAYINSKTDKASKGAGGFLLSLLSWPSDDDMSSYLTPTGSRKTINGGLVEDDNPFWDVNKNVNNDINDRITGNVTLSYDPTKWLNLTAIHGIDYYTTKGTWFLHPQSNFGRGTFGSLSQWNESQRLINGVYRASVRKKYGNVNNTLVAAFTFDTRKYEINSIKGEKFFDPTFVSINNTDPLTVASKTTNSNWNRAGLFATYNGNYKNWLNFSGSVRMDMSSRLVDPVNYTFADASYGYWSLGGNIIFTDLIKKLPSFLKFGKVRINYATTGRDPSAPYVKGNRFDASLFTGGGFTPNVTQGNPTLRSELSTQFETGLELKFFNNRLGIDFAFYQNETKNQLINPRISYASGAILQWINGGTTQNKGTEFQITASPIKKKNLVWDIIVNYSRNRQKIIEMPAGLPQFYNSDTWIAAIRNIAVKGGNSYQLASNRFLRNNQGELQISPTTGLPLLLSDYTVVGDRQSDFEIGLINTFSILKNISFSFNLGIRVGGDVYNGTEDYLYNRGLSLRTLDRETPRIIKGVLADGLQNTTNPTPNNIIITPLFRSDYYTSGTVAEDFIEKDINWVRLRDLTLTYNLPNKLIKRQKAIKSASVSFTGTDLFILTNYSGADPAANANNTSTRGGIGGVGMDYGNLATPRGLLASLRLQF